MLKFILFFIAAVPHWISMNAIVVALEQCTEVFFQKPNIIWALLNYCLFWFYFIQNIWPLMIRNITQIPLWFLFFWVFPAEFWTERYLCIARYGHVLILQAGLGGPLIQHLMLVMPVTIVSLYILQTASYIMRLRKLRLTVILAADLILYVDQAMIRATFIGIDIKTLESFAEIASSLCVLCL